MQGGFECAVAEYTHALTLRPHLCKKPNNNNKFPNNNTNELITCRAILSARSLSTRTR